MAIAAQMPADVYTKCMKSSRTSTHAAECYTAQALLSSVSMVQPARKTIHSLPHRRPCPNPIKSTSTYSGLDQERISTSASRLDYLSDNGEVG
eukprot:667999-Amphidinium_carterae.1